MQPRVPNLFVAPCFRKQSCADGGGGMLLLTCVCQKTIVPLPYYKLLCLSYMREVYGVLIPLPHIIQQVHETASPQCLLPEPSATAPMACAATTQQGCMAPLCFASHPLEWEGEGVYTDLSVSSSICRQITAGGGGIFFSFKS
uniref:Uncharacterized protein n=1 Tax=Trypanosoma vivax (strain Y486) TaxID=1055687 RepID=G0U1E8_TRYVY|nr:hypothetical protein TVY486_0805100 [Trypanosoma vivax Y486]